MEENPRKPRWFQYSLRTLLAVVTICAVLFAVWSNSARKQREAVAVLRTADADVYVEYDIPRPPHWPNWLVQQLGMDYFANVNSVVFVDKKVTDAGLEQIKNLAAMKTIGLQNTQVTDAGLEHVTGLTALECLNLSDTKVTDAGLEHIKSLTSLKDLELRGTKVTDTGVWRLKQSLPNCRIYHGPPIVLTSPSEKLDLP